MQWNSEMGNGGADFLTVIPAKAGIQRVGNGVCVTPPPPKFRTSTAASANIDTP